MAERQGAEFPERRNLRMWDARKVVSLEVRGCEDTGLWTGKKMGVSAHLQGSFCSHISSQAEYRSFAKSAKRLGERGSLDH